MLDRKGLDIGAVSYTHLSFAWIGEIEDERLLTALEHLKKEDLEIITLYAYEGYSVVELSKVYRIAHQNISKRIARITKFLKLSPH